MKNLPARITIGRQHSNGDPCFFIEVIDADAGVIAFRLNLTAEALSLALTGLGHVECAMDWYDNAPIGKKREHKTEIVKVPRYAYGKDSVTVRHAVARFEVNGWEGRDDDATNGHRCHHFDRDFNYQNVTYVRYVEKEGI